jgi:hypothetical protein
VKRPSQADLLSYLLGTLEAKEQQRVDSAMVQSPELRAELQRLELVWEQIKPSADERPPLGLAQRTCSMLDQMLDQQRALEKASPVSASVRIRPEFSMGALPRRRSASDLVIAAAACLVLALVFIPAIANSRFQAHVNSCQNNLREIGRGLESYGDDHDGRLIRIPIESPLGVAGIYAPEMRNRQLIEDDSVVFCPSASLGRRGRECRIPSNEALALGVAKKDGKGFQRLIDSMGGDYAYSLGFFDEGQYQQPRLVSAFQVLLADSPDPFNGDLSSSNHGGRGQNVLLGDFSVRFSTGLSVENGDNMYLNAGLASAPGLSPFDSVVGASGASPVRLLGQGN